MQRSARKELEKKKKHAGVALLSPAECLRARSRHKKKITCKEKHRLEPPFEKKRKVDADVFA